MCNGSGEHSADFVALSDDAATFQFGKPSPLQVEDRQRSNSEIPSNVMSRASACSADGLEQIAACTSSRRSIAATSASRM
jgi:hypothetical protein